MKDMGRIVEEIQSDANARDKSWTSERLPQADPTRRQAQPYPLPAPLNIDDLLELAAKAKSAWGPRVVELSDHEAFQLGEGCQLLASALDEERKQRAAEQAARAQVTRETTDQIARLCSLVDDLRCELSERKAKTLDLERRITAANDQAERDDADLLAAEHACRYAERALHELQEKVVGAMTDLPSAPSMPAGTPAYESSAYELPDDELAWFVAQARDEQRLNGIVHPLAALADRVESLRGGGDQHAARRDGQMVRVVLESDFDALMAAVGSS